MGQFLSAIGMSTGRAEPVYQLPNQFVSAFFVVVVLCHTTILVGFFHFRFIEMGIHDHTVIVLKFLQRRQGIV